MGLCEATLVDGAFAFKDHVLVDLDVAGLVDPSAVGTQFVVEPVEEDPALLWQVLDVALDLGDHLVLHDQIV